MTIIRKKRDKRLTVCVEPELSDRLDRIAAARGHTRASIAAWGLRLFVEAIRDEQAGEVRS